MTSPKKQETITKVTLRIPATLNERIRQAAEYSGRTLNSEFITWLENKPLADSMDDLKQQNQELRRLVLDTLEAVNARK